ncbi:hypothetical protein BOTBODRAFT_170844 [Botryobasidium botryosum FD-172 SS1]|uniref:C2H2-type domain-containing protein n=1 Tax=Botryobasidium botryosum (strain FD-172 SS1) TaxID=930990 RepID=A0A067N429_BOTB1|nr:hypothetical protein BOTBODRAFT_170844 [Botryobasidium botryosum FD-172 SS1]
MENVILIKNGKFTCSSCSSSFGSQKNAQRHLKTAQHIANVSQDSVLVSESLRKRPAPRATRVPPNPRPSSSQHRVSSLEDALKPLPSFFPNEGAARLSDDALPDDGPDLPTDNAMLAGLEEVLSGLVPDLFFLDQANDESDGDPDEVYLAPPVLEFEGTAFNFFDLF